MEIIKKIIKQSNDKAEPPVTIAFLGDSVTQGCFELYKTGERSFQTEFRIEDGYHTKLRSIIQMLYPDVPINMIHAGISGDNAKGGLMRVERDVCAYKPDLTVVCFGLNDCCKGRENIASYKESVYGIFTKLKECGSEIIFMTPNLMADAVSAEVTDEYTKEVYENMIKSSDDSLKDYIAAAKEVCCDENVPVCDCFEIWQTMKENGVDTTRL
ncbi:MAG: GDSL family lipase, partial [Clostridia bacterium]|nr:GDSL family lipase [Clostridia bacterium]